MESARAEIEALAQHLDALMLTNKALQAQLADAKRRTTQTARELSGTGSKSCRRTREDEDEEIESRPRYRCEPASEYRCSFVDDFDDSVGDTNMVFRGVSSDAAEEALEGAGDTIGLSSGTVLSLSVLRQTVAALGSLALLGNGAKDELVLAQLERLSECGLAL